MEYSGGKKQHFRHLLFFAFHRGQKAAAEAWYTGTFAWYTGTFAWYKGKANLRQENGLRSSKMAILTSTTRPAAEDLLNLTKTISKHF